MYIHMHRILVHVYLIYMCTQCIMYILYVYMLYIYILYNCMSLKLQSTNNRKHNICLSEAGSPYLIHKYQIVYIFLLWLKKPTVNKNHFFL